MKKFLPDNGKRDIEDGILEDGRAEGKWWVASATVPLNSLLSKLSVKKPHPETGEAFPNRPKTNQYCSNSLSFAGDSYIFKLTPSSFVWLLGCFLLVLSPAC